MARPPSRGATGAQTVTRGCHDPRHHDEDDCCLKGRPHFLHLEPPAGLGGGSAGPLQAIKRNTPRFMFHDLDLGCVS